MRQLTIFLSFAVILATAEAKSSVSLNRFGHIDYPDQLWQTEQQFTDSAVIKIPTGFLCFDFTEHCQPVTVTHLDFNHNPAWSKSFAKIINLRISKNSCYAAFFDGKMLVVLETTSGACTEYPASVVFALDDHGQPAYIDPSNNCIAYRDQSIAIDQQPLDILFYCGRLLIAVRDGLYEVKEKRTEPVYCPKGSIFEVKVIDDNLYLAEREDNDRESHFTLLESNDLFDFTSTDQVTFSQPPQIDTHEPIRAPLHYWESSFPSLVRNAYGQIQEWEHVYLHPGVDLFEAPDTEVYAVADGIVRAIITTGDERYWRIAIERFDVPEEGYLYAHLNQDSFPFVVGDSVQAGEVVGTLFPAWGFSPHVHFARISPDVPGAWNGNWWTVDNPLVDVTNMTDTIPPVLEPTLGGDLFAFRTPEGEYLNPMELSGEVDVISKVVDYAYSVEFESRIVPFDLNFRLYAGSNPDSVVYEQYSFALDYPLDTYFNLYYYTLVIETIYSRDETCFSTNNNTNRDFYFILTNSDGDSVITEEDSSEVFDTAILPNGPYLFEVIVRDCALNQTSAWMPIVIDNIVPVIHHPSPSLNNTDLVQLTVSPNPANPATVASLELRVASDVTVGIYDITGRLVESMFSGYFNPGDHKIVWNTSRIGSGIYFIRLESVMGVQTKRVMVIR
jgi:hypothetical protein